MTKCLWEDEEIALVLNWIDHCLENDEDFSSTIAEKLRAYQRKYGPARTGDLRGAARKKLNDLTKLQNGPSCATIIAQGTACLIQANCIRPSIQTAINAGRPGLGLGLIDWSPKSTVQKRNSAQHSHPDVDLTVDDSPMDIDDDHSSSQKVLHPAGKDQKVRNDQATSRQTSGSPLTTLASASSEPDTNRHPPHPRASEASKPDKQTASPSGHSLPRPVTQSLQQIQMPLSGPMHSQIQMESIVPHFPLSSGAYSVQRERVSLPLPSSDDLGGEWEAVQFAIKLPGIEKNIPETDSQKLLHHFYLSVSKLSNNFGLSAGCTFELSSIKPGPSVSYSEAVRSVLGHLVCQWVFVSPEPMLPVSFETKLLYNNILKHFRCMSTLRDWDQSITQLRFGHHESFDPIFDKRLVHLCDSFARAVMLFYPNIERLAVLNLARQRLAGAVRLKQEMMLSPKEYRIHYAVRNVHFDKSWMMTEFGDQHMEETNADGSGARVKACLFPALAVQPMDELSQDAKIERVFTAYKRFFPEGEVERSFSPVNVIRKALVVLE